MATHARRNFSVQYSNSKDGAEVRKSPPGAGGEDRSPLLAQIQDSVIGEDHSFLTPFGNRRVTYADYTASGRSSSLVENFVQQQVLPSYANTHTTTSYTGLQTTLFRNEAREIVWRSVGGDARDAVLFTGCGSTAAVNKMIIILGLQAKPVPMESAANASSADMISNEYTPFVLKHPMGKEAGLNAVPASGAASAATPVPAPSDAAADKDAAAAAAAAAPVVFVGPFEHHSNILPWRESIADVVNIRLSASGGVDMPHLEEMLIKYGSRPLKVGSFSAASNLTGVLADVDAVTIMLHRHGALAFWDYAAAAPYVGIEMNPQIDAGKGLSATDRLLAHKDAVFISPHKFVGGPGTPGVLVLKKKLLQMSVPSNPGGGTVFFVTDTEHRYLDNIEEREEGGTPDIIGSIRCGLVFKMKELVGAATIETREQGLLKQCLGRLRAHRNVVVVGDVQLDRLPIVSLMLAAGGESDSSSSLSHLPRRFLHYNFVCALLNDLFGIQMRGGCSCAGPFAQALLGMSTSVSKKVEAELLNGHELLRPGVVRFSLNYFLSDELAGYITDAILFVAEHGARFLPAYTFFMETGEWKHKKLGEKVLERRWLADFAVSPDTGRISFPAMPCTTTGTTSTAAAAAATGSTTSSSTVPASSGGDAMSVLNGYLEHAESLVSGGGQTAGGGGGLLEKESYYPKAGTMVDQNLVLTDEVQALRWFVLPSEVVNAAQDAAEEAAGRAALALRDVAGPLPSSPECPFWPIDYQQQPPAAGTDISGAPCVPCAANALPKSGQEGGEEEGGPPAAAAAAVAGGGAVAIEENNKAQKAQSKEAKAAAAAAAADEMVSTPGGSAFHKSALFPTVAKKLQQKVGAAIRDFDMIHEGDRLMVGLSGGKDSLTLLHVLVSLRRKSPVKFDIGACTIDPQTEEYDPSPMRDYLAALGIPYFLESECIIARAKALQPASICSYCARMKRGKLYTCCRREGYNVLVLGQHLDDLGESFVMSAFNNGLLRTMKANYTVSDGDLRVIRPMVAVREVMTRDFARTNKLPIIEDNCPACFEAPKERHRVKRMLAAQEHHIPFLFPNLLNAMHALMDIKSVDGNTGTELDEKD